MAQEESRLAALCLHYLTFESLASEPKNNESISSLLLAGLCAFLDYATLHWVDHLDRFLTCLELEGLKNLDSLGSITEDFLAIYGEEDMADEEALLGFDTKCDEARNQTSFATLVSLINSERQSGRNRKICLVSGR
jgi:hypothetical protein